MARETKLDDLRSKRICDALRKGHSYAAAARAGGIDEATLHRWRARGRDGEDPYREFCARVDAADEEAENRALAVITGAFEAADQRLAVTTAQWWLERRRSQQWAKKNEVEEPLTTEEAEALVAEAAQLIAAGGKP